MSNLSSISSKFLWKSNKSTDDKNAFEWFAFKNRCHILGMIKAISYNSELYVYYKSN